MAIYLVQHGKSHSKDDDPRRGLTDEGVSETKRIAEVAGSYGVIIRNICHSGKWRAEQTAAIYSEYLKPEPVVSTIEGIAPNDDVSEFSKTITGDSGIMYIGHLPFMERLISYLVTGSAETPVFKFQNSGIVCMDLHPDTGTWIIKWTLMPRIS